MSTESGSWVGLVLADGRYRVTTQLGEGGMAFIYKAADRRLDRDVVIKVPRRALLEDDDFAARFGREISSLAKLAHPHIVEIFDSGRHDGMPFAVMQYLAGGSLRDRQRLGPNGHVVIMSPEELPAWLPGVVAALDFIHQRGCIHRDVSPENILFDDHGHVYLSDFGIAKVLGRNFAQGISIEGTRPDMLLGKPTYMAPEILMGKPGDGRVDQYALAVTLYELLSGCLPAEGPTPAAVLVHLITETPPPLAQLVPTISETLSAVVQRGLSREPGDRYPSCTAFADAILKGISPPEIVPPPIRVPVEDWEPGPGPDPPSEDILPFGPRPFQYLLPAIGLVGLVLAVLVLIVSATISSKDGRATGLAVGVAIGSISFCLLLSWLCTRQ